MMQALIFQTSISGQSEKLKITLKSYIRNNDPVRAEILIQVLDKQGSLTSVR